MAAKLKWTDEQRGVFIDALLHEAARGTLTPSGFRKGTWRSILAEVTIVTGGEFPFTILQLQTQFAELKRRFFLFKDLQETEGFAFDEEQCMLIAPRGVWMRVIAEYPMARSFHNKPMRFYRELELLFGSLVVTNQFIHSNAMGLLPSIDDILGPGYGSDMAPLPPPAPSLKRKSGDLYDANPKLGKIRTLMPAMPPAIDSIGASSTSTFIPPPDTSMAWPNNGFVPQPQQLPMQPQIQQPLFNDAMLAMYAAQMPDMTIYPNFQSPLPLPLPQSLPLSFPMPPPQSTSVPPFINYQQMPLSNAALSQQLQSLAYGASVSNVFPPFATTEWR